MPNIQKQIEPNSLQAFSTIAYQCLNLERKQRPTTAVIVEQLQTSLEFQTGCRRITRTRLWGSSTGGSPWSFQLESHHKLRKITIDHHNWIYSFSFTTEDLSGLLSNSARHGGTDGQSHGHISVINFDTDEEIIGILGTIGVTAGMTVISSLTFKTSKKNIGPFGKETRDHFSVPWDGGSFAGFYGRAGAYLDGIGFYLKAII